MAGVNLHQILVATDTILLRAMSRRRENSICCYGFATQPILFRWQVVLAFNRNLNAGIEIPVLFCFRF